MNFTLYYDADLKKQLLNHHNPRGGFGDELFFAIEEFQNFSDAEKFIQNKISGDYQLINNTNGLMAQYRNGDFDAALKTQKMELQK